MRTPILLLAALLLSTSAALAEEGTEMEKAADFTLPSLAGGNVSLSDFAGKNVVVVNFWATWCDPCMKELPKLDALQGKLGPRGLQIISITVDEARDESKVRAIVARLKYRPVVLLDSETRVVDMFNKRKDMPWTMVIGADGLIHHRRKGFTEGDEVGLEAEVEALLPK